MKSNTKSSITLPNNELKLVEQLMKKLKAKSKVEVVRRGLLLLQEQLDRESLQQNFLKASLAVRNDSYYIEKANGDDIIDDIPE